MGRAKRKIEVTEKQKALGYRNEMVAIREAWNDSDKGRIAIKMKCSFGLTKVGGGSIKSGGFDAYYAHGEAGELLIQISGPAKDVVNLMFEEAIKRVGFIIKKT